MGVRKVLERNVKRGYEKSKTKIENGSKPKEKKCRRHLTRKKLLVS